MSCTVFILNVCFIPGRLQENPSELSLSDADKVSASEFMTEGCLCSSLSLVSFLFWILFLYEIYFPIVSEN